MENENELNRIEENNSNYSNTQSKFQVVSDSYSKNNFNNYINKENMSDLKSEYEHNMVNLGKEVVVINSDAQFEGVARGINDSGELLIQDESGRIICVRSGEVSVRGIYGYV